MNLLSVADTSIESTYGLLSPTGRWKRIKHRVVVECICQCGNVKFVRMHDLVKGVTKSCGCLRVKHGMSTGENRHPLYFVWRSMITRCYYPSHKGYKDYGAKGVTICDEWRNDFKSFHDWALRKGWKKGLTIDRVKNELGYSPNNCRWVSNEEQQRNKTSNFVVTAFGETKCVTDWGSDTRSAVNGNTIKYRIGLGWNAEKAIITPNMNISRERRSNAIYIKSKGKDILLSALCEENELNYHNVRAYMYNNGFTMSAFNKYINSRNKKAA